MVALSMSARDHVKQSVSRALSELAGRGELGTLTAEDIAASAWVIERPKRAEHGDYATNAAMVLTKKAGKSPRAIAEALVAALAGDTVVSSAEIAGPGFVNLRIVPAVLHRVLEDVRRLGTAFGRAPAASGERIHLEFVSANPTGPITVAASRNAILGDAIARTLEATGNRVTREYYVNDFGNQVKNFAKSVLAVGKGEPVPEDGYKGAYIEEIAKYLLAARPELFDGDFDVFARECIALMMVGLPGSTTLPGVRRTLASLGVFFDVWFSEESLHRWGAVQRGLADLDRKGFLAKKDGAEFFVTKDDSVEQDKERAVRKSDGTTTYFASDIAYFSDKLSRGYDRLLIVLGADHHGYVSRIKNALSAIGMEDTSRFEAMLYQLVFLFRAGEAVKMGKRAGNVVTADEVMDEIDEATGRKGSGRDALRFFFLLRSATVQVDFDIDLAKKASLDNPVFYVQYGHARLSSILKKGKELGFEVPASLPESVWAKLVDNDELALARKISEWPDVLAEAAALREPHRIAFFVQELGQEFQSYFTQKKVDPILPQASLRESADWRSRWDTERTIARLAWVQAVRAVYASALVALGVSTPDRMDRPEGADAEKETDETA